MINEAVQNHNVIQSASTPSAQMRAVLLILDADPFLKRRVESFIDRAREQIDWNQIFKLNFSKTEKVSVAWAYSLWTDTMRPRMNYFDEALNLDQPSQVAILSALKLRWGLA